MLVDTYNCAIYLNNQKNIINFDYVIINCGKYHLSEFRFFKNIRDFMGSSTFNKFDDRKNATFFKSAALDQRKK